MAPYEAYLPGQVEPTKALSQLHAQSANNMGRKLHWISISPPKAFYSHILFSSITPLCRLSLPHNYSDYMKIYNHHFQSICVYYN
jgi:hypothetical protein